MEADQLNRKMLRDVRKEGFLKDQALFDAFLEVRRHDFVPVLFTEEGGGELARHELGPHAAASLLEKVYVDAPVVVAAREGQVQSTSSQPTVMAMMLELADLKPGMRVLEVGTGSGYNAAVMAKVVGDPARIVTVEKDADQSTAARENLRRAGYGGVTVVHDEGGFGHSPRAPYDTIVVTCACTDVPSFWNQQLVEGGTLVLPLATRGVEALAALKKRGDVFEGRLHHYVRFMCMTGAPSMITHYAFDAHNFGALAAILDASSPVTGPLHDVIAKVVERRRLLDLAFYLAVVDPRTVVFEDEREAGKGTAYGLWARTTPAKGFAFVTRVPGTEGAQVLSYGDEEVLRDFEELVQSFLSRGEPHLQNWALTVTGAGDAPEPAPDRWDVKRTHCHTVFTLRR